MSRTLLVQGVKQFKITIPDDASVTFGPFSPPTSKEAGGYRTSERAVGTLRVYKGKSKTDVLAVFADVKGFRDLGEVDYAEEVAREEGAIIWKSDRSGYRREEKVNRQTEWVEADATGLLPAGETSGEKDEDLDF